MNKKLISSEREARKAFIRGREATAQRLSEPDDPLTTGYTDLDDFLAELSDTELDFAPLDGVTYDFSPRQRSFEITLKFRGKTERRELIACLRAAFLDAAKAGYLKENS